MNQLRDTGKGTKTKTNKNSSHQYRSEHEWCGRESWDDHRYRVCPETRRENQPDYLFKKKNPKNTKLTSNHKVTGERSKKKKKKKSQSHRNISIVYTT